MIKNTIVNSFRLMSKAKLDTIVKILGLGLGLAVCTICTIYVLDELAFNAHYDEGSENIYRVLREYSPEGMDKKVLSGTAARLSELLTDEYPEIEHVTRYNRMGMQIKYENEAYNGGLTTVDSAFFGFQKPHVALFGIKDKNVVFALFPYAYLHSLVTAGLHGHSGPHRHQQEC